MANGGQKTFNMYVAIVTKLLSLHCGAHLVVVQQRIKHF